MNLKVALAASIAAFALMACRKPLLLKLLLRLLKPLLPLLRPLLRPLKRLRLRTLPLLRLKARLLRPKLRLRRRSSNRLVDYCLEPDGSMTARAELQVCPGFVFLGEA